MLDYLVSMKLQIKVLAVAWRGLVGQFKRLAGRPRWGRLLIWTTHLLPVI